jgi:peptidoglycan/xylan/chitin deacetylase (PgdA/CDA1 family)/TolA-binding protein
MRPPRYLHFRRLAFIAAFALATILSGISVHSTVRRMPPAAARQISTELDEAVSAYRKIIVLMSEETSLDPITQERAATLGRILFQQNKDRLADLSENLSTELGNPKSADLDALLDHIEKNSEYRDADKLVFRELFEDLAAEAENSASSKWQERITEDLAALDQIQALYQKEIGQIFSRLHTRGIAVRREAWEHYLAFLKEIYSREQILKENEAFLPPTASRGVSKKKSSRLEMFGYELPKKTLLLTFDDGPHPRYTDQILEILKKYGIQAVFFQVGRNIGTVDGNDNVTLTAASSASRHILESGSSLGNHSYTHAVLSKLDEPGYSQEIETTNKLLKSILKADPVLFRPPYGATNDAISNMIQSWQMKSMIWNIDSEDWADPVPNSIAQRVLDQAEREGRGIILFHDIHKRTVELLPQLIEALEADGYRFASWNGTGFLTSDSRGVQSVAILAAVQPPYRESWAAVIGIDAYQSWPKLRYATNDAQAVRDVLIQKYDFKPDHVFVLLDKDATRQSILSLLGDKLGNPDLVKHEDRVFVFFAGHGATRKLPSGRDLGYIIPVDADLTNYQGQAISMTNFQDIAEAIPAKHVLFVMDSCYSGLALTRGGGMAASQNYLQEITRRGARQMFTAGGSDQQVADNGPNGHSVFTWTLLQALDGRADMNGDGVITATELAAYVAPAVSALSRQTPAFGNLVGSEGGDFIFDLKHESEFLNADSAQLGDDAIKLNSEVERLRAQNAETARQNENLKKQLAAAQAILQQSQQQGTRGAPDVNPSSALNDEGMRLYKEKKYSDAAFKFAEAARLDPANALFPNNAGFAYYKMEQYEEAVRWFQRAIALDHKRAVAWLNLGDAYAKMNRSEDAGKAYEKYLELAPDSKVAPDVREKLKALAH